MLLMNIQTLPTRALRFSLKFYSLTPAKVPKLATLDSDVDMFAPALQKKKKNSIMSTDEIIKIILL